MQALVCRLYRRPGPAPEGAVLEPLATTVGARVLATAALRQRGRRESPRYPLSRAPTPLGSPFFAGAIAAPGATSTSTPVDLLKSCEPAGHAFAAAEAAAAAATGATDRDGAFAQPGGWRIRIGDPAGSSLREARPAECFC